MQHPVALAADSQWWGAAPQQKRLREMYQETFRNTPRRTVRWDSVKLYYSLHTEGDKWSYLHIFAFCWRLWYDSSFHVFPCDSDNTPSFCWQKRLWSTCFSVQLISKPLVAIVEALRRHSWVPWCCPLWKPMLIPLTRLADPKYDAVWPVTWYMIHEFSGLQMAAPIVSALTPLYTTQPCASKKKTTAMSQDSHPNAADLPNQKVNQINRKPTSQRWKLQLSASLGFFLTPGRWRRSSSMTSSSHQKRERSGTDALMQKWYVLETQSRSLTNIQLINRRPMFISWNCMKYLKYEFTGWIWV